MNIALILSGGTGTRLEADIPKQYLQVSGRRIISYCMDALLAHNKIDAVQIVADLSWHQEILKWMEMQGKIGWRKKFRGFSVPGENRQLSIWNGLKDIRKYARESDYVLIHDAARPLLSAKQITDCLNEVKGYDGVMPVLPMKDTVYSSGDGKRVDGLLKREQVYAGQAPEVFRLEPYYEANKRLLPNRILEINGSAEPAVMAGMEIVMIPGDERNFKITTKEDLKRFRGIITEESY